MSFNLFSQLFGSKAGHQINSAVDNALPAVGGLVSAAVPASAPIIAALTPHPTGTTATISVSTPAPAGATTTTLNSDGDTVEVPAQPTTLTHTVEIGEKVLIAVDPNLPAQLDELITNILHRFGALGDDGAKWVEGYLNAKLEDMGFNAPTVVAPAEPATTK